MVLLPLIHFLLILIMIAMPFARLDHAALRESVSCPTVASFSWTEDEGVLYQVIYYNLTRGYIGQGAHF